eukprot:Em0022g221a
MVDGRSREEINFIRTKLDILAKRTLSAVNSSEVGRVPRSQKSTGSTDNPIAVQFCQQCIKVHCQNEIGPRQKPGVRATREDILFSHCGQIERLRLEAQKSRMKAEIACTSNESFCAQSRDTSRIRAALAEELFVRYKIHAVRQGEFNSRLNDHLLYRDSTSLLAEVIRSCARPQASSEEVWQALWRTHTKGRDVAPWAGTTRNL